ncbi:MAG: gliding-motility protein MglA [Deltaproteobacteria bacterium]|nr:gliding-motility protein MglA [Deltaproteobacteria bacterium]MBI4373702.1 gliding-motility protein MglA [Deltaproteobacteria bacterium]
MSFINPQTQEINGKIVYCGPPFSGKTTNLSQIYERLAPGQKGKLVSLAGGENRTLFFDFLPLSLGEAKGKRLRLHLYTVPGQPQLEASRKMILKGVDGVVFVVDSQVDRLEAALESWKDLGSHLRELEIDVTRFPIAVQFNKRDLKNGAPLSELKKLFPTVDGLQFESIAIRGEGVMETLQGVTKQVLKGLGMV